MGLICFSPSIAGMRAQGSLTMSCVIIGTPPLPHPSYPVHAEGVQLLTWTPISDMRTRAISSPRMLSLSAGLHVPHIGNFSRYHTPTPSAPLPAFRGPRRTSRLLAPPHEARRFVAWQASVWPRMKGVQISNLLYIPVCMSYVCMFKDNKQENDTK